MAIFNLAPCLLLIIVLVIFGLDRLSKSGKAKDQLKTAAGSTPPKRMGWVLYFGIAFVLAYWTIWGALFFLVVVWVLRMDPKPYSPTASLPSDLVRDSIKSTYTWLWISPVLTIPTMLIASYSLGYSTNNLVLAALIPLVFHTPLLFRLNIKNLFVYRHAQLAILLVALRAGMAALALNIDDSWVLFLLGNGSLWFFGTLWARNQVVRNQCWLMQRKGETIILSETVESENLNHPIMDKELTSMLDSLNADSIKAAKEKALHAFQTGTPTIKKRAVAVLAKLGEVEKF